jgi:hypothetical protein
MPRRIGPEPTQYGGLRHQIRGVLEDHNRYPDNLAAEVAGISLTPPRRDTPFDMASSY